jgi:hypothetical protein
LHKSLSLQDVKDSLDVKTNGHLNANSRKSSVQSLHQNGSDHPPPPTSFKALKGAKHGSRMSSLGSMLEDNEDLDWENKAYDIFAGKTGDELYEQLTGDQFKVSIQRAA